jgi:Rha family phage regulatory protein
MSNPCLDAVTRELDLAGVPYRVEMGGKHVHVHYGADGQHLRVVAATPSDHRAPLNDRAGIRRELKAFGYLSEEDAAPAIDNVPVRLHEGQPSCFSYDIAKDFNKAHKDVLRVIDRVRDECGEEFDRRNFAPVDYLDAKGRSFRAYRMSRDGFSLVVMGFTGSDAMAWKVKYIAAFNAMASELARVASESALAFRSELDALVSLIGDVEAKAARQTPAAVIEFPQKSRHQQRREFQRMTRKWGWQR